MVATALFNSQFCSLKWMVYSFCYQVVQFKTKTIQTALCGNGFQASNNVRQLLSVPGKKVLSQKQINAHNYIVIKLQ